MEIFKEIWKMIVESDLLRIAGALAVLLIGWLIALLASSKISGSVQKWTGRRRILPDGTEIKQVNHADTLIGKVIYYIVLIFAVLGCFSILGLDAAASPLQDFISRIARYAPNIAGALLLAVLALILGSIAKALVRSALQKSKLNERLAAQMKVQSAEELTNYTAQTVYYLVFLFFLPAILNALEIYGITKPLQSMFEKVLTYLPNLLSAVVILLLGLWVAQVVRKAVTGLVVISRLNSFGEQIGISKVFGNNGLASMIGVVAYVLVVIPVVISSLTALQIEVLSNSVAGFFDKLLNGASSIIGASLIIFVAVLAGSFASTLIAQLTAAFGLNKLIETLGVKSGSSEGGVMPSVIVGKICHIAIVVMALLAGCEILGFTQLAALIRSFSVFGGNVLLSIVVLLIGIWLANFAASVVKGKCNELLVSAVRLCVVILTVALAVSNLQIGNSIVQIAFALILGAFCVAGAIAFGVGGRETAAKLLNDWMEKLKK